MTKKNHMAVDQYGTYHHNLGDNPKRELLDRLGRKKASPMYQDYPEGTFQTGWAIGDYWLTVFEVIPMRMEVTV